MSDLKFTPGFLGSLVALLMLAGLPGTAHADFASRCAICHGGTVNTLPNGTHLSGSIRAANNRAYLDAMIAGGMTSQANVPTGERDGIVAEIAGGTSVAAAAINSAAPPGGTVGTFYSHTVTASGAPQLGLGATSLGGDALPNAFTVLSGALPPGLSIDGSSGNISGMPTTGGTFTGSIGAYNRIGGTSTQSFSITIVAPPPNDNFASAATLTGGNVSQIVSTTSATKEAGEPNHAGNAGGHSVWWNWTAPSTNPVAMDTCYYTTVFNGNSLIRVNQTFDTLLAVYTGNAVNSLIQIAANDDDPSCFFTTSSYVSFNATQGTTYRIAVDGYGGVSGNAQISVYQQQTLTIVNSGTGSGIVTSSPAGISCPGTCTASFPPNTSITLTSTPDPGSVFVGIGGQSTNPYTFTLTGGTTDYVNFYALTNDNFATPKVINPFFPSSSGYNIGATKETGEPNLGYNTIHSVWWSWTAPTTGAFQVNTFGSNLDTVLGVFTGSAVNTLTTVGINDDFAGPQSAVTFYATAGNTYYFAVDGYDGQTGYIAISVVEPGNDNFASRLFLTGGTVNVVDYSVDATRETGEPRIILSTNGGHSLWWSWTAPTSDNVTITTVGSNFDTILGVYTGSVLSSLVLVAQNDDFGGNATSSVTFAATAGITYQIAVDSFGTGIGGNIALHILERQPQNISFPAIPNQFVSPSQMALVATATSGLPVAFSTSTPTICTVAGSNVTAIAIGTCSIFATQAGNASFYAANLVIQSFMISQGTQTITFGAQSDQSFSNGAVVMINPAATASSSLAVSYTSNTMGVCTVSGNAVSLLATGMCSITASQPGNANYAAAMSVTRVFTISPGVQSITFGPQMAQNYSPGGSFAINPLATASSNLTVAYASTTPGVCSVSGANVNILSTGTCTIAANQAGNANFNPALLVTQNVAINPTVPGAPVIGIATPGDTQASIAFTAPANNGGRSITNYRATCNPNGIVGNSGASPVTVPTLTNGTLYACYVAAMNGVGTGTGPSSATVTVTPTGIPVPPLFSSVNATTFTVLSAGTFNVTATGTPVPTLSIAGTPPTGVGFTPGTGALAGTPASGTVGVYPLTFTATNASGAPTQSFTLTVQKANQTITFNSPGAQNFSAMPVALTATASSMLGVSFASSTPSTCSVSGASFTMLGVGSCTIDATQSGNGDYNAATTVSRTFMISPAGQTITFPAQGVPSRPYAAGGSFAISPLATASSGLPVTYSSLTTSVCSVSGTTVGILAAGTCTIAADQAGNASIVAAPQVTRSVTITAIAPGAPTITSATPGDTQAVVAFNAPTNSGGSPIASYAATCGAVTVSGPSSPITVTTLTNNTSITCTVKATNAAVLQGPASTGVQVTPISAQGATIWATTCATGGCHGAGTLPQPPRFNAAGSTPTVFNYVASIQPVMSVNPGVQGLTAGQRTAVVAYLLSQAPPISATTPFQTPVDVDVFGNIVLNSSVQTIQQVEVVTPPANGALSVFNGTIVTYTPNNGFSGTDSFTYRGKHTLTGVPFGPPFDGDAREVTITVQPPIPVITSPASATGTFGQAFSYQIAATNLPTLFGASGLPMNLSVNTGNGLISGNAIATGVFNATITAGNASNTDMKSLTITISQAGQLITFPAQVALTRPFSPGGTFPINPPASGGGSGNTVVYGSATPGVCTVNTSTVTIVTAGVCTLTADQAGNGNFLAAATVTQGVTVTPVAPGAPLIGTATPGNASATIAFTPPMATGGSPINFYTATCNNGASPKNVASSPITLTGLVIGTLYTCSVTATGNGGTSVASGSVMVTPVSVVPPGAPTIGPATPGNTQASITFTPPGADGGGAIIDYTAICTPGNFSGTNTVSPITVTGLANGTAYNCSVTARNVAGSGPSSTNVAVMPLPTLALASVVSRKTHGAAGSFDIIINSATLIGGLIDIEPRAIGSGHTLVFTFNNPITAAGSVSVTDSASMPVGSASAMRSGNDVVVTLTGTPDNQRVTVTLTNVNGTVPPITTSLGFLIGDVNNTRSVNASDISGVKARSGKPTDASNFKFDLNTSGDISSSDISAVKARSGATLAP